MLRILTGWACWCMTIIQHSGHPRQEDQQELEISLGYMGGFRASLHYR